MNNNFWYTCTDKELQTCLTSIVCKITYQSWLTLCISKDLLSNASCLNLQLTITNIKTGESTAILHSKGFVFTPLLWNRSTWSILIYIGLYTLLQVAHRFLPFLFLLFFVCFHFWTCIHVSKLCFCDMNVFVRSLSYTYLQILQHQNTSKFNRVPSWSFKIPDI